MNAVTPPPPALPTGAIGAGQGNMAVTAPRTTDRLARRGLMFILSSPSGAGKTTIARRLLREDATIVSSVSATTRPMRAGEVEGVDYHFVTPAAFEAGVAAGDFMEWAQVFGHWYATPKAQIKAGLKAGHDFLFDIDWQGTQQLYQRAQTDVVRVFLLPPSLGRTRSPPDCPRDRRARGNRRAHGACPGRNQPLGRL